MTDTIPQEIREELRMEIRKLFKDSVLPYTPILPASVILKFDQDLTNLFATRNLSVVDTQNKCILTKEQLRELCEKWQKAHYWENGKIVKPNLDSLLTEIRKGKK